MIPKHTAWANLTIYSIFCPFFVSYAPLINFIIQGWKVELLEKGEISSKKRLLGKIAITPIILLYLLLMDAVFLFMRVFVVPVLIIFSPCFKRPVLEVLDDAEDYVFVSMFEMNRIDVNGFRRLRTISQLVFESVFQIFL